jgi:hypothetical protein
MVLSQVKGEVDEVFTSSGVRQFDARGKHVDGWGRNKFIATKTLKSPINGLYRHTISCGFEIRVMGPTKLESKPYILDEFTKPILSMSIAVL